MMFIYATALFLLLLMWLL